MPTVTALLAAITAEPVTTDEVYTRVGYPELMRLGLIPYPAFRDALIGLESEGLVERGTAADGATTWRLPAAT